MKTPFHRCFYRQDWVYFLFCSLVFWGVGWRDGGTFNLLIYLLTYQRECFYIVLRNEVKPSAMAVSETVLIILNLVVARN